VTTLPPDAFDFVRVELHSGLGHGSEEDLELVRQAVDVRRQVHLARGARGDVLVALAHRGRQHALQPCANCWRESRVVGWCQHFEVFFNDGEGGVGCLLLS
jgi:hypothetical protein